MPASRVAAEYILRVLSVVNRRSKRYIFRAFVKSPLYDNTTDSLQVGLELKSPQGSWRRVNIPTTPEYGTRSKSTSDFYQQDSGDFMALFTHTYWISGSSRPTSLTWFSHITPAMDILHGLTTPAYP